MNGRSALRPYVVVFAGENHHLDRFYHAAALVRLVGLVGELAEPEPAEPERSRSRRSLRERRATA